MSLNFKSLKGLETQILVNDADNIVQAKLRNIKTHQIRNFYGGITKIKVDWKNGKLKNPKKLINAMVLIKPKLAYAAARNTNLKDFYEIIKSLIGIADKDLKTIGNIQFEIDAKNRDEAAKKEYKEAMATLTEIYDNFMIFMGAIVAYHKFYDKS